MVLADKVGAAFKVLVAASAAISTFYTAVELTLFLSAPKHNKEAQSLSGGELWASTVWSLLIDQLLVSAFLLTHSGLAAPAVKDWLATKLRLQVLQRSVYVIVTSLSLQVMMKYWQSTPAVALWHIDNMSLFKFGFVLLHIFSWIIIYVGSLCMDTNEMIGIKQVYYDLQRLPDPCAFKSHDLKRLYKHMRHPSFLGFLIIFWAVPCLSLDRLLLAGMMTVFMYLAWNPDRMDYHYQKVQFDKKYLQLNCVQ